MAQGHIPCGVGVTLEHLGYDEVALLGSGPAGLGPVLHVMALLGFPFCPTVATAPIKAVAFLSCGDRAGGPAGVAQLGMSIAREGSLGDG